IVDYAKGKNLELVDTDEFNAMPGHGISATVDHSTILVGNRQLMTKHQIPLNSHIDEKMTQWELDGKTVMLIAIDDIY
ncbi:hypothetical protein WL333_13170, partial [Staphylococcus epidermidis]